MKPGIISPFRRILLIPGALILIIMSTSCDSVQMLRKLKEEMKRYPESDLVDIYKSWFQSVYGPGHLLTDSVAAIRYLHSELEQTKHYQDTTYWYPLGIDGRFGRLNLYVAAIGKVPVEDFSAAFSESGKGYKLPEIHDWHQKWDRILSAMEKHGLKPGNYDSGFRTIDSLLLNKKYVVHHSSRYIYHYDPHYRVITTDAFIKLRKRYLAGK